MNASLRWLRDFVGQGLTASQARDLLTARCATVESVVPVRQDLGAIVVARVVEVERHPESDHLWLTKVDAGGGELLEVVCGAANVSAGTLYPFAPVGSALPGGTKIERRKIRGRTSNGMLCSARELGLGDDHEGILALDVDAKPGARFTDVADTGDFRLEIDVLPNRPDLLSHRGLARELAAALGTSSSDGFIAGAGASKRSAIPTANGSVGETDGVTVRIDDAVGCPRYAAVIIRGVTVAPSPPELAERLAAIGLRSINNVVDVTNYMLHGYGQPMHAFDLRKLGSVVVVRRAERGEKIVTLDGVARELTADMMVIAGAERAEAIGGVIGGRDSEVTDATTDILLEVATFDSKRIRRTRKALGVSTDASYRFERYVDPAAIPDLAARAAAMIASLTGGKVTGAVDVCPEKLARRTVPLRLARVAQVLGERVSADDTSGLLATVGFKASKKKDALAVTVPSWRSDVVDEIDLVEEVARLRGYESFSSELRPFRPSNVPDDPMVAVIGRVRDALIEAGLLEIRPVPFVSAGDPRLRVRNPLAENEAFLRSSLLDTLAGRVEHNLAQMQRTVRLFEIGTVFAPGSDTRPTERVHAAAALCGAAAPVHFTAPVPRDYDAWDCAWAAQVIAGAAYGTADIKLYANGSEGPHAPLWSVGVGGKRVGRVVLLDVDAPAWAAPAFAVEIDITDAGAIEQNVPKASMLPVTPAAEFDLALIVPDAVPAAKVEGVLRAQGGEILERVILFDEYRGSGVPDGARSLAWRLTFRHPDRTLRDKEIEARRDKLIRALEAELGVKKRTF